MAGHCNFPTLPFFPVSFLLTYLTPEFSSIILDFCPPLCYAGYVGNVARNLEMVRGLQSPIFRGASNSAGFWDHSLLLLPNLSLSSSPTSLFPRWPRPFAAGFLYFPPSLFLCVYAPPVPHSLCFPMFISLPFLASAIPPTTSDGSCTFFSRPMYIHPSVSCTPARWIARAITNDV